jgi:hypothetical protein
MNIERLQKEDSMQEEEAEVSLSKEQPTTRKERLFEGGGKKAAFEGGEKKSFPGGGRPVVDSKLGTRTPSLKVDDSSAVRGDEKV